MRLTTALLAVVISVSCALEVGSVEVTGNSFVSSDLIIRVFGLGPGDLFSQEAAALGTRDLFGLGYFSNVEILSDSTDGTDIE